jgi:UDP-N-acetylglucosamine acyltransferase
MITGPLRQFTNWGRSLRVAVAIRGREIRQTWEISDFWLNRYWSFRRYDPLWRILVGAAVSIEADCPPRPVYPRTIVREKTTVSSIHPMSFVSPTARIGKNVEIGPFSVVEDDVVVGDGCRLASHVVLRRGTRLGENNSISEGAVLGGRPQHLRAGDSVGELTIGNGNSIRENVTIHLGLRPGEVTSVGDENLIMVNAHIAHDCHVGSNTIIANNVMLAGHISVGNRAYLSGAVAVHQFCRIGPYAMVGGQAHIKHDVPPYVTVDGKSSLVVGLNTIGLRRNGFDADQIRGLKNAYRLIYRSGMAWDAMLRELAMQFAEGPAAAFHPFLSDGKRGFLQERRAPRLSTLRVTPETVEAPAATQEDAAARKVG